MNYVYEVSDRKGNVIVPVSEAIDSPEKAIEKLNKIIGMRSEISEPLSLRKYSTFEWSDDNGEFHWEVNAFVGARNLIASK